MPTIWGKYKDRPVEKIDTCGKADLNYMLHEYRMAYGALPGQHAHKDWKIWVGRKCDEPGSEKEGCGAPPAHRR